MAEVEITLKTVGPSRPSRLHVPPYIKVGDLRRLIAEDRELPLEQVKLVLRGKTLRDKESGQDVYQTFKEGDFVMVAVAPKPAADHLQEDDDDDDVRFRIPESTRWWKMKLFTFLQNKLRLPDVMLMALFSISLKGWALIVIWFIMASISHKYDLGPLFILGTGFAVILINLEHRQQGDLSAFSIFNEGFRELPGTLNADRLDRDIRACQL